MQDRVPVNPGRVLITPESGSPYYATLTRADNPTQEGTPLNKANLLKDTTAALLGGNNSMVPDEALVALFQKITKLTASDIGAAKIATCTYTGTGTGTSKKITFSGKPQIVFIIMENNLGLNPYMGGGGWTPGSGLVLVRGQSMYATRGNYTMNCSFANDSVTLNYGDLSYVMDGMNEASKKYLCVAVCAN